MACHSFSVIRFCLSLPINLSDRKPMGARSVRKLARMVEVNEIRMLRVNREAISSIP